MQSRTSPRRIVEAYFSREHSDNFRRSGHERGTEDHGLELNLKNADGTLEIGRPIQPPMLLWPKPLDLRLERGFDRPVRRLNGDHASPGIGDTAGLADVFDLRTLLREGASAQS